MALGLRAACSVLGISLLVSCAPDVQQQVRQAQRDEVHKLTSDLGTPNQVRAQFGAAASVLGAVSVAIMQTPGAAGQAAAVQSVEQAVLGEQHRLRAVAASSSDDEFVVSVAHLCTPEGLNDTAVTGQLLTVLSGSAPSQAVASDPAKLENFHRAQQAVQGSALLMAQIQGRCREGNAAVTEAGNQAREQADEAHREQAIFFSLLAARLSAPRVNVNQNTTVYSGSGY